MRPSITNSNSSSNLDIEKRYDIKFSLQVSNPLKILEDFYSNLIVSDLKDVDKFNLYLPDPEFKLARDLLLKRLERNELPGFTSLSWMIYSRKVYESENEYKNSSKDMSILFKELIIDLNLGTRILKGNVYFIGDYLALKDSIEVINKGQRSIPYTNVMLDWLTFCPNPHTEMISNEIPLYDEYEKFYLGGDNSGDLTPINISWLNQSFKSNRFLTDIKIAILVNDLRVSPEIGNWLIQILKRFVIINESNIEIIINFIGQNNILPEQQLLILNKMLRTISSDDITVGMINRIDYISKDEINITKLFKLILAIFSTTNIGGSAIVKLPLPNFPMLDAIYVLFCTLFPVTKLIKLKDSPVDDDTVYLFGTQFNLTREGDVILNETKMKEYITILNEKIEIESFLAYLYSNNKYNILAFHHILNNRMGKDIELWIEKLLTENGGWKLRNIGKI